MARLGALAALIAGLAAGAGAVLAFTDAPRGCEPRGLRDAGTLRGDGVLLARVTGVCGDLDGAVSCTIGDGTSPIAGEVVPRGVAQDCAVFNQYIGAGLPAASGYLSGECFTYARVSAPGLERTIHPENRCRR